MSGVVQVAYLVDDVWNAARRHHATFGSGPFFVAEHIGLSSVTHQGSVAAFDHSSAYGQWGAIMVELLAIHAAEPASLARAARVGGRGLHHVARFVVDLDAESTRLTSSGYPQVLLAETGSGQRFAFHDGGDLGHLLEIYQPGPALTALYRRVAEAAEDWDGAQPVRPI
jgi:hypothetical protein